MPFTTGQLKNRLEAIASRIAADEEATGNIRMMEPTLILAYSVCLLTEQLARVAAAQESIDSKTPVPA